MSTLRLSLLSPRDTTENQMWAIRTFIIDYNQQVTDEGLMRRIKATQYLCTMYDGQKIVSFGALKNPDASRIQSLFALTGVFLGNALELGWLATHPGYQHQGLSTQIVRTLLSSVEYASEILRIFAATHVENILSQRILNRQGFYIAREYADNTGRVLRLYLK